MPFSVAKLALGAVTIVLSAVLFAILMGIGWLFGGGGTGIAIVLWVGGTGVIRFVIMHYMEVAPTTQITFDLYSKLSELSYRFKELFNKGQQEQLTPAYAASTTSGTTSTISAQPTSQSARKSIFCGQCGAKNESGIRFCDSCGTKIE